MSKFILSLTLLGLIILFAFGIADPNSPVVWLASTWSGFAWIRLGLIVTIVLLLVTNPPRNIYLRLVVGFLSTGVAAWVLTATYQNEMKFLDTFSLLAASISSGLIVLEREDFAEDEELETMPQTPNLTGLSARS